VVALAAGEYHVMALQSDGTIVSWGNAPDEGEAASAAPEDAVAIAAGDAHSLALRRDGTVVAWGANNAGQCAVPPDLGGVTAIAAGGDRNLALVSLPPPSLAIALGATHSVVVSWPQPSPGWTLECATNLVSVGTNTWTLIPPPYQTNSGVISVNFTNTPPLGNQFFRLHKP
jgi:hypothetical protein